MIRNKSRVLKVGYVIELTPDVEAKIEQCIRDFLPKAVEKCLNEKTLEKMVEEKIREMLTSGEIASEIELAAIPRKEAIVKIKSYIDEHPDCTTSDIIYDLGLDPNLVLSMLDELQRKGLIKGGPIE